MSQEHAERLVYTKSEDGYLLEGALFTPADSGKGKLPIVWMHGFTGRFYEEHTVAIGRRLASLGHVFVTGNNRGHHLGANLPRVGSGESLRGGAFWEKFEESPRDYAAWVGFAVGLGFPRVVLVGHSLGALKVIHYGATRPDPRVAAIVSASGPIRVHRGMRDAPDRVALAQRMVQEGRGDELLPRTDTPGPMSTSAQTLASRAAVGMDMYGLDDANPPVGRITCPLLFILGSEEPFIGTKEDLPMLLRNARRSAKADTLYVEGADHLYVGRETVVADGIAAWVEGLS